MGELMEPVPPVYSRIQSSLTLKDGNWTGVVEFSPGEDLPMRMG